LPGRRRRRQTRTRGPATGISLGFACRETENLMPGRSTFAHNTCARWPKRGIGAELGLGPDAKSQVTLSRARKEACATSVVVSTSTAPTSTRTAVRRDRPGPHVLKLCCPTVDVRRRNFYVTDRRFVHRRTDGDCGGPEPAARASSILWRRRSHGGRLLRQGPTKVDRPPTMPRAISPRT